MDHGGPFGGRFSFRRGNGRPRATAVMAVSTGGLSHGVWVALTASSPAMIDTTPTGRRLWMRQVESCLIPIGSHVARSAIRSECSGVKDRVCMAGMAVPWRGGEISRGACIQVAFHTGHDGMFAVEFESKTE